MITKPKFPENSYQIHKESCRKLSLKGDPLENHDEHLCAFARRPQKVLKLPSMINTILKRFPMSKKKVFTKFYFFCHFWMDFVFAPLFIFGFKPGFDPILGMDPGTKSTQK